MSEGCSDDVKNENFSNVKCGFERENSVDEDGSEENSEDDSGDSSEENETSDEDFEVEENSEEDSDDSSEENETGDEDFEVDEVNEISDSDENSSLYVGYYNVNYYKKKCEISTKPLEEEEIEKCSMKGSSSKVNEVSQKQDKKSVDSSSRAFVDENEKNIKEKSSLRQQHSVFMVEDIDKDKDNGKANANDTTSPGDSGEAESLAVSLQNEKLAKHKIVENKGRGKRGGNRISNGKKKKIMDDKSGQSKLKKELHKLLEEWEYYLGTKNTKQNGDSVVLEVKDDDGVNRQDTRPQDTIWSLGKKVEEAAPKMEEEELWDEMDRVRREDEVESMIGNIGTNVASNKNMEDTFSLCNHDTRLDEEIGVYCRLCDLVVTEIRYISEPVVDRYPNEGSGRRASIGGDDVSLFDWSHINVSDYDSKTNFSHNEGTVWDKIPDVKQTLYPHQQEGFEFIWKNMAGSIELQNLKNADPRSEGGCIISHAPGTGKTRLTIVFLKAYLKVFPKCMPIIVAPASILLTWEEEFKKWDIGVPFHNLSSRELSGKEHADAVNTFNMSNTRHGIEETRMAKLISWFKETSILGISYDLYGMKCKDTKKKKHESVKERKRKCDMQKILLKAPGLLVLDEGHTPRNQRSHIWKVLSKIQTQKRIILSGTPFQNNFWELYTTLSLVKPSFPDTIPPELKRFCHERRRKSSKQWSWEPVSANTTRNTSDDKIEKLKLLMDPFVHVHKGAILENKLPGLRDCLVTLKAGSLQTEILKIIKRSQNTVFNFEHKIALTSVHPSLLLECDLSEDEESVLNKDQLEKIRLNPYEGVKTKFLCELVRLCDSLNEKVLVFSQFHAPLQLIKDQLNSAFNWSNGEVLFMSSKDPPKDKQSIIHSFNDENSKAKILLAATKACSEGISLVGASRVVLLDVVWNPSVKRQAISRAYRIGQKKVVYIYQLLAEGTTEEEKYGKQAEKDRLSELLFSAKTADNDGESKNYAVKFEDSVLDKMTRHGKLRDMFVECVVLRKERDLV
ncbi:SNF2 domain-containing protein CLASSY 3-like [Trifolium pratense]|uniref:SNF2 domain-containing protein CLASSY 3-like n=1 Tax=Trifolium pratense TaxID=57577 RepID=UPI001E697F37|nr:SNF2 domain-containing protein CLASSY 3-like [Trifolium pratense]